MSHGRRACPKVVMVLVLALAVLYGCATSPQQRIDASAQQHGYERLEVGDGQWAFVAAPEKALLDLIYLQPGGDAPAYLAELRLQTPALDLDRLARLAEGSGRPKLRRAAQSVAALARSQAAEYEMV